MPSSRKQNRFTFTLFDYDNWTVPLAGPPSEYCHIKYVCFGEEICPDTSREHLQGYIVYHFPILIADAWAMDFDGQRGRLFVARGSTDQNVSYCSKDGKFSEFGDRPDDAELAGVQHYVAQLEAKTTTVERIVLEMPAVYQRFSRTLERAEDIILGRQFRDFVPTVYWLYGPTGSGKTREAINIAGDSVYWYQLGDHGWQDGYSGQTSIIIDDFRGNVRYEELLRMFDRYPYSFPRRGRRPTPCLATTFIVTSSLSPYDCYPRRMQRDSIAQLERRITEIRFICPDGSGGELGSASVIREGSASGVNEGERGGSGGEIPPLVVYTPGLHRVRLAEPYGEFVREPGLQPDQY